MKGGGIVDSLTKFARGSRQDDANAYSELEMHAELCYAEVLLLRAVLTLCEDENLVSFVKAGLKVRSCYQSFRFVVLLIEPRNCKNTNYDVLIMIVLIICLLFQGMLEYFAVP